MSTIPATPPRQQYILATSLIIPDDGQRQAFDGDKQMELARSIASRGLIHAIVVRPDGHTVVVGRRRLKAIRELLPLLGGRFTYAGEDVPSGHVPCVVLQTNDPLELEEIELAENEIRADLTWQEKAAATAKLMRMRQIQHARALASYSPADGDEAPVAPSVASIALETRGTAEPWQRAETKNELIAAQHLNDPAVAKAGSLKDAMKILVKRDEANRTTALALAVGKTHRSGDHTVLNVNCLDWMRDPANHGKFDVILTDPPYGMGAHEFGDGAGRLANIEHHYDDSYEAWKLLMAGEGIQTGPVTFEPERLGWCALSFAVAKPEAHCYVWCDIDRFHELRKLMQDAGWRVHRTPLTNFKKSSGRVPWPDMGPRRQSEWCLYAVKGDRKTNYIASDVIVTEADEQLSHGAQKPVALYDDLLRRSVKPGNAVLDSFGGTGTLLPAAHALKCYATVLEQNPTYYGICLERVASLDTTQKELPL